jgi:hypothetical protein
MSSPRRRSFRSSVSWFDLKARFFVPTCAPGSSASKKPQRLTVQHLTVDRRDLMGEGFDL